MKKTISDMMFKRYVDTAWSLPEFNSAADFSWIQNNSGLPWLKLDIVVPYSEILAEIQNIQSLLVTHREDYNEHQGWSSFCIHGKSYDATREDSYYNDNRPHCWTPEAQELMPETVEYFRSMWPANQYQRVRVMRLDPGGYITIHRDSPISALGAVNIAITQPNECLFVMEKYGTVPFESGDAIMLDLSNRHVVFNNSDQVRWHMIVHQDFDNQNFKRLVVNSYNQLYN
jgi:Aspartyl/Asparaginyl beta-hydroxylase